jgi:hypothetical protein
MSGCSSGGGRGWGTHGGHVGFESVVDVVVGREDLTSPAMSNAHRKRK